MSRHREGELGAVPFRSGRFFYIDSKWYFSCREGREVGPFTSKQAAEMALAKYIDNNQCVDEPRSEDSPSPSYHPTTSP